MVLLVGRCPQRCRHARLHGTRGAPQGARLIDCRGDVGTEPSVPDALDIEDGGGAHHLRRRPADLMKQFRSDGGRARAMALVEVPLVCRSGGHHEQPITPAGTRTAPRAQPVAGDGRMRW